MSDNLLLNEVLAAWKRREIEDRIEQAHLASLVEAPPPALRGAIAAAIVRFGIFLDDTAGRQAAAAPAAPQH